jgi:hypothetical protein
MMTLQMEVAALPFWYGPLAIFCFLLYVCFFIFLLSFLFMKVDYHFRRMQEKEEVKRHSVKG